MDKGLTITRKQIVIAIVVIALLLLVWTWQWRGAEERRRAEEIATAEGLAQVVSATFAGRTDLKVSDIRGTIDVTSVDRGIIFDSTQKATLPFTVDYFVDLSGVGPEDARFDANSRRLVIDVPEVRVADPNIDLTKGRVDDAEGFWVSRQASANLVRRALTLTRQQATTTAQKPEHVTRAREEARSRIGSLLEMPLKASGQDDIQVVVRFPADGHRDGEQWDVSPSIQDVLDGAQRPRQ